MARPNFFKVILTALGIAVVIVAALPAFNSVQVRTSSLTVPIVITRNGQDVPPSQIRSIKYLFGIQPIQSLQDIKTSALREAYDYQGLRSIDAKFSFYRYGTFSLGSGEASPAYQFAFVRVEFTDGKIFSLSFPILADHRESGALFADFSGAP